MARDWRGGTTEWLPAEHRQVIALVRDLRERLQRLPMNPGDPVSPSLASLHRTALDDLLTTVMSNGDRARIAADAAPATVVDRQAPSGSPSTFFVAVCDTCTFLAGGEALEMPFGSVDDRAEWCQAHTDGTGHAKWQSWRVN
jgi:hypothetical protein